MKVCYQVWETHWVGGEIVKQEIGFWDAKYYDPVYLAFTFEDRLIGILPMVVWKIKNVPRRTFSKNGQNKTDNQCGI